MVLIHYLITPEKLHILLTTPDAQVHRESVISVVDLNKLVFSFRQNLSAPKGEPAEYAQRLYDLMISPIAKDLAQAGASVLMVSLDGTLRYIPMAALHDGSQYVAERYTTERPHTGGVLLFALLTLCPLLAKSGH